MAGQYTNHHIDELNYWTPTNTNTNVPRPIIYDPNGNDRFSDRFVESGSYVKLTNAQIGYTFPVKTLAGAKDHQIVPPVFVRDKTYSRSAKYKGYDPEFLSATVSFQGDTIMVLFLTRAPLWPACR